MPILQSPCGQPVFCVPSRVSDLLQQGYRVQREVEGHATLSDLNLVAVTTMTGITDLNSASLKEMSELPGVGTAVAKKVREGRPYRFIEDLIEQIPEVPWLSLRDRVTLDRPIVQEVPDGAES